MWQSDRTLHIPSKNKKLVLIVYANKFYDAILLFSSLRRYRNSNHCKIVIFKLITQKLAMWIDSNGVTVEMIDVSFNLDVQGCHFPDNMKFPDVSPTFPDQD